MAGYRKVFLDTVDLASFSTGTHVNIIAINPLLYMISHNGTTLDLQTVSIQGVVMDEVINTGYDATVNIGKYTVDATTNIIWFLVDPAVITTIEQAMNFVQGILVNYQMYNLAYFGADPFYTMDSFASNGTKLGSTMSSDISSLTAKMLALDSFQNMNDPTGYYYHVYIRSLVKA